VPIEDRGSDEYFAPEPELFGCLQRLVESQTGGPILWLDYRDFTISIGGHNAPISREEPISKYHDLFGLRGSDPLMGTNHLSLHLFPIQCPL
jgi:hypothetical protein